MCILSACFDKLWLALPSQHMWLCSDRHPCCGWVVLTRHAATRVVVCTQKLRQAKAGTRARALGYTSSRVIWAVYLTTIIATWTFLVVPRNRERRQWVAVILNSVWQGHFKFWRALWFGEDVTFKLNVLGKNALSLSQENFKPAHSLAASYTPDRAKTWTQPPSVPGQGFLPKIAMTDLLTQRSFTLQACWVQP